MDFSPRKSRLTAGKADEVVADSGGPVAGHSVFTGHLIEALQGKAVSEDGIITANGVMAYVYNRVATDKNSRQTPHYGYFDGDADFIFKAPNLDELEASAEIDLDRLITIPFPEAPADPDTLSNKILRIKKLIPDDTSSIELHDLLVSELRRFLAETSDDAFPPSAGFTDEELHRRLESYEDSSQVLVALLACLNYWARPVHHTTISKILSRSVDRLESQAGKDVWLELRWYPLLLIMYSAGISAVAGRRYDALATVLQAPVPDPRSANKMIPLVCRIGDSILDLDRMDVFKRIPVHRNNYAPRSEYLFKTLQPILDETLFIGKEYESSFDRFEILLALEVADSKYDQDRSAWGPVGRFGWKNRMSESGPLASVIAEGVAQGENWPPIQAGLFRKDPERFKMVAESFNQVVTRLAWY